MMRGAQQSIRRAAVAGLIGTAAMDVTARLVAPALGAQPLPPELLGRWVGHLRRGRARHADITTAAPIRNEVVLGAFTHYVIGSVLGAEYGLLARRRPAFRAEVPPAVGYGIATTAFAWLTLFPSMGFGVAARHVRRRRLLELSLVNHAVFGLALGTAYRRLSG